MTKITFIGLGVMGYPMAGHLARLHKDVVVWNRNPEKSQKWQTDHAGKATTELAEAVKQADFVISCLNDDDSVREVTALAFAHMKKGAIFIDHSTTSAKLAKECAQSALKKGLFFMDAPVSGGEAGAQNGQLTIMCGGNKTAYNQAAPIVSAYAKACSYLGESGHGQLCKMVNQICVAGLLQGLAEGMMFAEQAGLDSQQVIDVISKGAAQSWQMDNRHKTMIAGDYDFGFAVDLMRKDLGICLDEAAQNNSPLPVTSQIDRFYLDVQQMGGNRWDTSSLLERLRKQGKTDK